MNYDAAMKIERDGGTFRLVMTVPSDTPDEYKQRELLRARERFAIELYSSLQKIRNPCVVTLDEQVRIHRYDPRIDGLLFPMDHVYLEAKLTPVEHQHVVMQAWDQISLLPPKWKEVSFFNRLRYVFTGKIK